MLICAKNEAENLSKNLPSILQQDYSIFEIVLVDDHSTDQTETIMKQFASESNKIVFVPKEKVENRKGKKYALAQAVETASYEYIVVTDADCFPTSKNWLSYITAPFANNKQLVLGLSPNTKHYAFWPNFFRFETYLTALQYTSFALRNLPYMGVGRNMAYTKSFFQKHFTSVLQTNMASGDDDLLVNFGANKYETSVVTHPDSFTYSPSPDTFAKWFQQKNRHVSAGVAYKTIHKLLLSLFPISFLVFFVTSIVLLFTPLLTFAITAFLAHFVTVAIIHGFGLRKYNSGDIVLEAPLYLLLWHLLLPIISLKSVFNKSTPWK